MNNVSDLNFELNIHRMSETTQECESYFFENGGSKVIEPDTFAKSNEIKANIHMKVGVQLLRYVHCQEIGLSDVISHDIDESDISVFEWPCIFGIDNGFYTYSLKYWLYFDRSHETFTLCAKHHFDDIPDHLLLEDPNADQEQMFLKSCLKIHEALLLGQRLFMCAFLQKKQVEIERDISSMGSELDCKPPLCSTS